MELTAYQKKILNAEVCPYCRSETTVTTEAAIYGRSYKGRAVIACKNFPECDAYVGTHGDGTPLGRLADSRLRGYKKSAHDYFDKIWKEGVADRGKLYDDLSCFLNLPPEVTHIGMFREHTCQKVISWAKRYYIKEKTKIKIK